MILHQVLHADLGCASYVVGDPAAGVLAVVDPKLDVAPYLALAGELGARIEHVVETHTHADHVSGHGALHAATGATLHVHRDAGAAFAHEPIDDGWELALGSVRLHALHTPGHRPEHTAFVVRDGARAQEPWALLTGDSLLVGDVARPDLAVERELGARDLHASLRRLLELPDHVEVWPGHVGGSLCGGTALDAKTSSTLGYERRHNELLAEARADRFAVRLIAGLGVQPPNLHAIVARNRGPLLAAPPLPPRLSPAAVAERMADGALLLDVRSAEAFDAGHVPGAICVPLTRSGFATRAVRACDTEVPLLLAGAGDADGERAARRLAAIGLTTVEGRLAGGMEAWTGDGGAAVRSASVAGGAGGRPTRAGSVTRGAGGRLSRAESLAIGELRASLAGPAAPLVLDVRDPGEWASGTIPGARNVPYAALDRLPPGLDPDRPLVVVCGTGPRAATAASLLRRLGARDVRRVAGGVADWKRRGWPLERHAG